MRTTLTVQDSLLRKLRRLAAERRVSLKQIVNEALQAGLESLAGRGSRRAFRQKTHDLGTSRFDLDKALKLADDLEADELLRKQALRK